MDNEGIQGNFIPHVLIFPLPIQSPVNTMLKLAELMCLAGLHVTFLITKHNHKRLLRCSDVQTRMSQYEGGFHWEVIEDGLPEDDPRNVEKFGEILDSLQSVAEPFLREFLKGRSDDTIPMISCVIVEGLYYYALDITEELGIPLIFFETISPACLWVYMCLTKLMEDGELPFKGNDLDVPVTSVAGMEGVLRRRDLPDFCRRDYTLDRNAILALESVKAIPRSAGLILNSFAELETPFLSHIGSKVRNLYTIGPLQLHLSTTKLAVQQQPEHLHANPSNSFWKEDKSCLEWLDLQSSKSVVYISFGSLKNLTNEEFLEFWHGILNSGHPFLWVIRPGSINEQELNHDGLLKKLNANANGLGLIVGWVPQEKVLAHPATGGFFTHSGWNSTMESIIAGVPMICWPCYVDQLVTSRLVKEVWKLGLDMKDVWGRSAIEKMIRDLMESKDKFDESAENLSSLARKSVDKGGSSHLDFTRFIRDVKNLSIK